MEETIRQSFFVQPLRRVRNLLYRLLEPADWLSRRLNRMPDYPPIALRRHVSHLGMFDGPGYEFVAYLKLLAGLKNGDRVWDLGCGCGMLELALETARWRGDLIGTDIHLASIRWARRRITPRYPCCRFEHADIRNPAYHPGGELTAGEWLAGFRERDFRVLVAKSFFTHLLPGETDLYLRAVADRLGEGGRGLLTFFILDERADELMAAGKSAFRFRAEEPDAGYAVRFFSAPSAAVAYREDFLRSSLAGAGLEIAGDIRRGYWSGRPDGLSFQDIVVVGKKA